VRMRDVLLVQPASLCTADCKVFYVPWLKMESALPPKRQYPRRRLGGVRRQDRNHVVSVEASQCGQTRRREAGVFRYVSVKMEHGCSIRVSCYRRTDRQTDRLDCCAAITGR
jgi:hypothetical protein